MKRGQCCRNSHLFHFHKVCGLFDIVRLRKVVLVFKYIFFQQYIQHTVLELRVNIAFCYCVVCSVCFSLMATNRNTIGTVFHSIQLNFTSKQPAFPFLNRAWSLFFVRSGSVFNVLPRDTYFVGCCTGLALVKTKQFIYTVNQSKSQGCNQQLNFVQCFRERSEKINCLRSARNNGKSHLNSSNKLS